MRLIGTKGTIDVIDDYRLQITYNNGDIHIVPAKELETYIKELGIYATQDGGIGFGDW